MSLNLAEELARRQRAHGKPAHVAEQKANGANQRSKGKEYSFRHLWDLGYRLLVPIVPPGAEISERSTILKRLQAGRDDRGKTPGVRGRDGLWRGFDWRPYLADEADLERWDHMGAGTGIKTGAQPDGTSLILIDADTLNEDRARIIRDAVERHFGRLPARIGRYPKVGYPIRAVAPFRYARVEFGERDGKGRLLDRVELLSDGRQFVAAGLHPSTGEPYHWPHPLLPYAELPIVEPAALTAFLDDLRTLLPAAGEIVREGATTDVNQASLAGSPALVRRTVGLIPNTTEMFPTRESWLAVGYAIRAALPDAPHEGLAIFQEWSDKWAGEIDEGGNLVTNDPGYTEAEWDRMKPPFRRGIGWLCELAEQHAPNHFSMAERWFDIIEDVPRASATAGTAPNPDAWPGPLDVYDDSPDDGFLDVSEDALPPMIWRYAKDTAERMGVPILFIAAGALAAISAATGSRVKLQPKDRDDGWLVPPFIWTLLVASPGSRKSAALEAPLKVLRKLDHQRHQHDAPRRAEWEDIRKRRPRPVPGQSPHPLPPRPIIRRAIVDNFTNEALRGVLAENPRGVLVAADEISGLFGSTDQYKGGRGSDRAELLKLIDGEPLAIDRVSQGTTFVPCWGASIHGSIQPDKLVSLAAGLETDGLLQRFLPIVGLGGFHRGVDREPDRTALLDYDAAVSRLANIPDEATETIRLSAGAQEVRGRFEKRMLTFLDDPTASGALCGHLAKWSGMFARLMLVFHVADGCDADTLVSRETAERVWQYSQVLLAHAFRFYERVLGVTSPMEHARRAADALLIVGANENTVTARDVYRTNREWTPGRPENRNLWLAMELLVDHGWCIRRVDPRTRRAIDKWWINPRVFDKFGDRAETERRRRQTEMEKIKSAAAERAAIRCQAGIFG